MGNRHFHKKYIKVNTSIFVFFRRAYTTRK